VWSGFALIGGGVALVALSTTLKTTTDCTVLLPAETFGTCDQGINKALLWSGVAAVGGGAAMLWSGTRHSLAAGPRHVTYRVRF
jgi:hypothetical protein